MLLALVYSWLRLLLDLLDGRLRVQDPEAELLLLRHDLRVVRRQVKRARLNAADRTIMAELSQLVSRAALVGMLVQPETVLGWHRELVRSKWAAFCRRRGPGRPRLNPEIRDLILQMAKANPRWGCVRVLGELLKLGHAVLGDCDSQFAASEPNRAGALEITADVEGVPASPGFGGRAHGFLQRRHRFSEGAGTSFRD
jgi:hypothetical protein